MIWVENSLLPLISQVFVMDCLQLKTITFQGYGAGKHIYPDRPGLGQQLDPV